MQVAKLSPKTTALEIANRSAAPGTFVIADLDGRNQRVVTLESYKAEIAAASAKARSIHAANIAIMSRR